MRDGWKVAKLEDVVQVVNGGTPKTTVPQYWGGEHLWVTPAEMGGLESPYIESSRRSLTDAGLKNSSASLLPRNSVILSTRAPIGHLVINAEPMAFNQGCRGLIPRGETHYKYLYYFLYSSVNLLNDLGSGTTFKELSAGKLKKVEVPLPPLPEQKRIVAILDEAFSGIATAVANTEKNLANARRLFESYLNAVFSQRGEGWTESPLETLVTDSCTLSYGIVQPGSDVRGGIPVVRPTDLRQKLIRRDTLKTIDPSLAKAYSRTTLHGGDLLLCVRGTTGDLSVAATELEGANVTRGIVPIRFNPSLLNQELGYHLLRSPFVQDQIAEKTYGAALMQINIKDVRKLLVLVPPHETHEELCSCLNDFSAETDQLQSIYGQKHNALSELKKSLLQKAFSGELTAGKAAADAMRQVEEIA